MLKYRVSHLDLFREWEDDDDSTLAELVAGLESRAPTEDMKRGTAFHSALEKIKDGEVDRIDSQGFTFLFEGDFSLPSFPLREIRRERNYDGLVVTGAVDGILGNHILDHKAATWFDAERYYKKYAWRYYLDIFGANRFTWYVWEMKETDNPREFTVRDLHVLEQFRYPKLHTDCSELAARFNKFAKQHLNNGQTSIDESLLITAEDIA